MRAFMKLLRGGIHLPLALSILLPLSPLAAPEGGQGEQAIKRVLLYEYGANNSFMSSKAFLRNAMTQLAKDQDFALTTTRDPKVIHYLNLKTFDVVLFAFAGGEFVASTQGQSDLERYIREGGGFMAIHSYPGQIRKSAFLSDALGAPGAASGGSRVKARLYADPQGIATPGVQAVFSGLPREVVLKDRWLNFGSNPREKREVTVLFSVDESTYSYGRMNGDHPIVWTQTMGKGRVVYNGLGLDNVYTQQNGFGAALLWNLVNYAANKNTDEPLAKTTSLAAPAGVTLTGNSMGLSLGEGSHVLRISDFQGKVVLSKTFVGPGQFHVDPALAKGRYTLTLAGPALRYQKPFTVR